LTKRIYIASSWKNALEVRKLAKILESEGHQVYDFTDETKHFSFNLNDVANRNEIEYIKFLEDIPESRKAFDVDKAGLEWADTVIMLQPCGRSSHLELGYGVGKGKTGYIYGDLPLGEYDCMYHFARCFNKKDLFKMMDSLIEEPRQFVAGGGDELK
jgi:hypothetical protein